MCRAVWRVIDEDVAVAMINICRERRNLDRKISELPGVKFCFSTITMQETSGRPLLHAVACFIVYAESVACNKEIIFAALHADAEAAVEDVAVRFVPDIAVKRLFRVVKDDSIPQCSKWSTNPGSTKFVAVDGRLHRELEVPARQLVMDGLKCEFSDSLVTREPPPRVRNPKWEDPSLPRASEINGTRRLCVLPGKTKLCSLILLFWH